MKNLLTAISETLFVAFVILFFFWLLFPAESPSGWWWFGILLGAVLTQSLSE